MNKKLIDLEGLKQYSKKIKENYVAKDADGNVVIQGNLEIKGISQTINQETLTIKDNFIAVNGDGTTLDTAGMAGIIAITGGEHYALKGSFKVNTQKLVDILDPRVVDKPDSPWVDFYGPYAIELNAENLTRFNNLGLNVYYDKSISQDITNLRIDAIDIGCAFNVKAWDILLLSTDGSYNISPVC